jgi:hypothetical protein
MGDFNINQQTDSPEKRKLLDIFNIFSLLIIPITNFNVNPALLT